jgi:hypothetical protein
MSVKAVTTLYLYLYSNKNKYLFIYDMLEGVSIGTGYELDGPGSIPGMTKLFSSLQHSD